MPGGAQRGPPLCQGDEVKALIDIPASPDTIKAVPERLQTGKLG